MVSLAGDRWKLSPKFKSCLRKSRKEVKRTGLLKKLQKISEESDII